MKHALWVQSVCLFLSAAVHATTIPIDACGVLVGPGDVGVLTADLVCATDENAVTLDDGAKLLLQGHSVSGGTHGVAVLVGRRRASIAGPGTLQGAARCGIGTSQRLKVRDVLIEGNGECGILNPDNMSLTLREVRIIGNAGEGIAGNLLSAGLGDGRVSANHLEVRDNEGIGVRLFAPGRYRLRNFVIRDNSGGLLVHGAKPGGLANGESPSPTAAI